jgi:hypothetical protein
VPEDGGGAGRKQGFFEGDSKGAWRHEEYGFVTIMNYR